MTRMIQMMILMTTNDTVLRKWSGTKQDLGKTATDDTHDTDKLMILDEMMTSIIALVPVTWDRLMIWLTLMILDETCDNNRWCWWYEGCIWFRWYRWWLTVMTSDLLREVALRPYRHSECSRSVHNSSAAMQSLCFMGISAISDQTEAPHCTWMC